MAAETVERWRLIKLVLHVRMANNMLYPYNRTDVPQQLLGANLVTYHVLTSDVLSATPIHDTMQQLRTRYNTRVSDVLIVDPIAAATTAWRQTLDLELDEATDDLLSQVVATRRSGWTPDVSREKIQEHLVKPYHHLSGKRLDLVRTPPMLPVVREYLNWLADPKIREYQALRRQEAVAQLCFPETGGESRAGLSDLITSHLDDGYEALLTRLRYLC